jgi:protein BCP1
MASQKNSKNAEDDDSGSDFEDEEAAIPLTNAQPVSGKDEAGSKSSTGESKKRKKDDEDDEAEGDEETPDVDDSGEIIPVTFDYYDPKPSDHYAVNKLLSSYLDTEDWKADSLAKLLCEQEEVGAMVKSEGEDQPYAFISALSMHAHKDHDAVKTIKNYFLSKASDSTTKAKLNELLSDEKKPLGLLIHERIINMPEELVPPLHDALLKDLEFVQTNSAVEKKTRDALKFQNFVLMTKCFDAMQGAVQSSSKKQKKAKDNPATRVFYKFEDEMFLQEATLSFSFAGTQQDATKERQTRIVMVFPAAKLGSIVGKLLKMLPPPDESLDSGNGMDLVMQQPSNKQNSSSSSSSKQGKGK